MSPEISFEFFPPRTEAVAQRLRDAASELARLQPAFCSVTYGAGGSSRDLTFDTVRELQQNCAMETVPHLAALGTSREEVARLLETYTGHGVKRLVAIRGDLPAEAQLAAENREVECYAADLVRMIREIETERFRVYVGAYPERHPEAPDLQTDVDRFVEKVDAGADAAVTQYFYTADAYESFLELAHARGVSIPIIAGVMPIYDFNQIASFSARCGAEIPRWFASRLRGFDDPESQRDFAADVVARLCEQLIALGAPGFHFYTLNRAEPTRTVLARSGLLTASS